MNLTHHPQSPHTLTEEEAYQAVTSGYRWVSALAPDCEEVRTLVFDGCLNYRLSKANPEARIFIFNPLTFEAETNKV